MRVDARDAALGGFVRTALVVINPLGLVAVVRNSADDGTVAPEYVILNHLPPVATCCHCHVIECGNPLVRHIFPKMPPLFHALCFRSVHLQGGIILSSISDHNVM